MAIWPSQRGCVFTTWPDRVAPALPNPVEDLSPWGAELCSFRPAEPPLLVLCSFKGSRTLCSPGFACFLCVTSSCFPRLPTTREPALTHSTFSVLREDPADGRCLGTTGSKALLQTFWSVSLQVLPLRLSCTHTSVPCF